MLGRHLSHPPTWSMYPLISTCQLNWHNGPSVKVCQVSISVPRIAFQLSLKRFSLVCFGSFVGPLIVVGLDRSWFPAFAQHWAYDDSLCGLLFLFTEWAHINIGVRTKIHEVLWLKDAFRSIVILVVVILQPLFHYGLRHGTHRRHFPLIAFLLRWPGFDDTSMPLDLLL